MELHTELKALAVSATNNQDMYNKTEVDNTLLERFPNPIAVNNPCGGSGTVFISAPEFTSLCPLTRFPDYATIEVEYEPDQFCLESKSWKLYLNSFRNQGEFHEACCTRMMNDLVELLQPKYLKVVGKFYARGGIAFWPTMVYRRPE